jgi:hypothetical protein
MAKSTRTLLYWGLVSLNGQGPYLAGYEAGQGTRCSTPLVEFDPEAGTAITSTGRPYHLVGKSDPYYGLHTSMEVWGQYFNLEKSTIVVLTDDEAIAMIATNGNAPYNRTIAEESALRRQYGLPQVADESEVVPLSDSISDLIIPDPTDEEMDELEGIAELDAGLGVDYDDVIAKALAILDRVPKVPPEPGDEMPDDPDEEPEPGRKP